MSVQVLQWNRKPPGELHMGPGATYPKLKYSSYYYVPPHSTWFGQLQLNCEKPLPYGWWLGAYFYYYPNYWRCQPHQWQDLVSSNGPRKFYVIISKKQLIGSQNLFKLGDITSLLKSFFSQIVIVKFSFFFRNFNGHSLKKYQDKCFLPWWVLKAFAGRPKTLFSFFFIIPTYHNSESPRIMVETTTDVPTVIYRCHVNSKWVTYQMRESSMPQSMSAKESVED